jgi:hypothetical protein
MSDRSAEDVLDDAVRARVSTLADFVVDETSKPAPRWDRVAEAARELADVARALDERSAQGAASERASG